MTRTSTIITGVLGFTALSAWLPNAARACEGLVNECLADLELVSVDPLPVDGAIVMRPVYQDANSYFNVFSLESGVTVTVTPAGGGPEVAGTLAVVDGARALVWRPDAPLTADVALDVAVTVDNSVLTCLFPDPPTLEKMWTVTTTAAPSPALAAPTLTGEASGQVGEQFDFDTLVCCDGALPIKEMIDNCGLGIEWTTGTCASTRGLGRLDVALQLDEAEVAAAGGQFGYWFDYAGGSVAFTSGTTTAAALAFQPICGAVRAVRLGTGDELVGPEVCFGQDLQDMLGDLTLDPAEKLAVCAGQPYTCEVAPDGWSWDPDTCTPWPGDEAPTTGADSETGSSSSGSSSSSSGDGTGGASATDTAGEDTDKGGCACATGRSSDAWGLLGLLLPWLARRRSRR